MRLDDLIAEPFGQFREVLDAHPSTGKQALNGTAPAQGSEVPFEYDPIKTRQGANDRFRMLAVKRSHQLYIIDCLAQEQLSVTKANGVVLRFRPFF